MLGPLNSAKDLEDVSTVDLSRAEDRPDDVMLRDGTAALIDAAGKSLAIELNTAVQRVDMGGRGRVELGTSRGTLTARTVIVTASTNVLASDRLRFSPSLPAQVTAALGGFRSALMSGRFSNCPAIRFRFGADERIIFKTDNAKAIMLHTRVGGSDLVYADLAGRFGRELANAGEAAVAGYIAEEFAARFGERVKTGARQDRTHALEQGAMGAGRLFGGGAGCGCEPARADGADRRPRFSRGRSRA